MSYTFNNQPAETLEQKIDALEKDVARFSKAWQSEWARPVDYTNLMDAQFSLRSLQNYQ
jgi:hypothetical protein